MRNSTLTLLAGLMALPLIGCTGDTPDGTPDRRPFRDDWRVEADVDFIHTAPNPDDPADLLTQIGTITIGGRESNDNFANRGDVIVNFDGPPNKILVEFRRFTTNLSEDAADEDFEAISLWAFNSSVSSPSKPDDMDAEANCITGGWLDGCGVRLYYDGQNQLARAGADIRVTLPPDYRRTVNVITEDASEDGDYLNRGNVCISGTNGKVDVEMQSGKAFVIISDEATPAPICGDPPNTKSMPSPEVESCNNATTLDDPPVNAAWSSDFCGCAMTGEYGVVAVESDASQAADIVVDVPTGLWASITTENQGMVADNCTATISVPNVIYDELGNDFPWEAKASTPPPSPLVTPGAGYNIQARSGDCAPVAFTENPDDFVGVNNGDMQDIQDRGNIEVCENCIRAQSCDQLLP